MLSLIIYHNHVNILLHYAPLRLPIVIFSYFLLLLFTVFVWWWFYWNFAICILILKCLSLTVNTFSIFKSGLRIWDDYYWAVEHFEKILICFFSTLWKKLLAEGISRKDIPGVLTVLIRSHIILRQIKMQS